MTRVHRFPYNFFMNNPPPIPHKGWTLQAFQEYTRTVLESEGFRLDRKVKCTWDMRNRMIVFWQEACDLLDSASLN